MGRLGCARVYPASPHAGYGSDPLTTGVPVKRELEAEGQSAWRRRASLRIPRTPRSLHGPALISRARAQRLGLVVNGGRAGIGRLKKFDIVPHHACRGGERLIPNNSLVRDHSLIGGVCVVGTRQHPHNGAWFEIRADALPALLAEQRSFAPCVRFAWSTVPLRVWSRPTLPDCFWLAQAPRLRCCGLSPTEHSARRQQIGCARSKPRRGLSDEAS
jgi:hypothetical protein